MSIVTENFLANYDLPFANPQNLTGITVPTGKLVVCYASIDSGSGTYLSVDDSAGNIWTIATQLVSGGIGPTSVMLAYSVLTAPLVNDQINIHLSGAYDLGATLDYFDSDTGWFPQASVLDAVAGATHGTFSTIWLSGNTAVTAQADELLAGMAGGVLGAVTSTPDAPWVEISDFVPINTGRPITAVWQHVVAASAYAASGNWSVNLASAALIATFKTAALATTDILLPMSVSPQLRS